MELFRRAIAEPRLLLMGFFLFLGLLLSLVSYSEWCLSSCQEAHRYRFFGYSFDLLGVLFFSASLSLFALHLLFGMRSLYPLALLLSAGLGAEVWFLLIQKFAIQSFCPICLSIAASLLIALLALLAEGYRALLLPLISKEAFSLLQTLQRRALPPLFTLLFGFLIAYVGVLKPESSFASGTSELEEPLFGNRSSDIEVYIVSDWFCRACKKLEPSLEKMLPALMERASVIFVDRAIHPESLNYLPYHLSFMLKEKPNYLQLRRALHQLALKTRAPTMQEVQEVATPLGVTYQPLHFADIESGLRFFQGISHTFQINSTPTVVVANKRRVEAKKLVGNDEISEESILYWIDQLKS